MSTSQTVYTLFKSGLNAMIKLWLAKRRMAKLDVEFRTGFLYAVDRALFRDGEPLLHDRDLQQALLRSPAFADGHRAGVEYSRGPCPHFVENSRRKAYSRNN